MPEISVQPVPLRSRLAKLLLLLSGGPDSTTLAYYVDQQRKLRGESEPMHALYLKSGHAADEKEIEAANQLATKFGVRMEIADIDKLVKALGGKAIMIHSEAALMPFGNALALSIATVYALQIKADTICLGLHKDDADENGEYTRGFIDKIEALASFARSDGPVIETPFIHMDKTQVFSLGKELQVDYSMTWSCIRSGDKHCGLCGACRSRRRAFDLAGVQDPTKYEVEPVALESALAHDTVLA
jgi:7-cyano-7-deazaguanine synthase